MERHSYGLRQERRKRERGNVCSCALVCLLAEPHNPLSQFLVPLTLSPALARRRVSTPPAVCECHRPIDSFPPRTLTLDRQITAWLACVPRYCASSFSTFILVDSKPGSLSLSSSSSILFYSLSAFARHEKSRPPAERHLDRLARTAVILNPRRSVAIRYSCFKRLNAIQRAALSRSSPASSR